MMCMLLDDISVSDRRESNRQGLQLVLYNLAQRTQNKTFSTVLVVLCYVLTEIPGPIFELFHVQRELA